MASYAPSSQFYADELRRALGEQLFGIEAFSITVSSPTQAAASVKLLEGMTVTIKLNLSGFAIDKPLPLNRDKETYFESIEALLRSVSRLYERRGHEALVTKLEMLL